LGLLQTFLSVQLVLTDRFVDLAEEGFDLAIRLTQKPGLNLVARKIAPIHFVVCASPDYLKRMGKPRTPQDLAHHNCLFYAYQSVQDRWSFEGPEGNITVRVQGNFQVNSSEAIREALLRGVGIGLVPTFTVGQDLKSGILQPVLKKYRTAGFSRSAYAVYLPNRNLSPKVRAFIDFLVERFGEEPYWDS
jgi:DNA-binding transcriptional LysR family regulator